MRACSPHWKVSPIIWLTIPIMLLRRSASSLTGLTSRLANSLSDSRRISLTPIESSQIVDLDASLEKLVNIDNAPSTSAASHVTADPVPSIPAENAADSRDWRPNYYGDMNDEEIDFGLDEIDGPRSVSNPLQRQTCANVNDLVLSNLYSNAAACNCTPSNCKYNKPEYMQSFA